EPLSIYVVGDCHTHPTSEDISTTSPGWSRPGSRQSVAPRMMQSASRGPIPGGYSLPTTHNVTPCLTTSSAISDTTGGSSIIQATTPTHMTATASNAIV